MTSPTLLHTARPTRPSTSPPSKSRRIAGDEQPAKKPKKANSEIRKQQNRIASKNYREKRKRKLQYLQKLFKEGPEDQPEGDSSSEQPEAGSRSLSVGYESSIPSSSPYLVPSNIDFASANSTAMAGSSIVQTAHSPMYNLTPDLGSQTYSPYAANWSTPIFSSPPMLETPVFSAPFQGADIGYLSQMPANQTPMQYITPSGPPVFAHGNTPPSIPQDFVPNADYFAYGPFGVQSQAAGMPINLFDYSMPELTNFISV